MKLTDEVLVEHIIYECEKIHDILAIVSHEQFLEKTRYQDALIRPLEVIGEAAGNLSPKFLSAHPEIPVANMKGMRNLLMHQYFRVDLSLVWHVYTGYSANLSGSSHLQEFRGKKGLMVFRSS